MDDPLIPAIFAVVTCCALILFLWEVVLTIAKEKLPSASYNAAKFLLFLLSLPLGGIAIHYGSDIVGMLFGTATPF
jgi:hypothetical protein